jgi:hypothetical protein
MHNTVIRHTALFFIFPSRGKRCRCGKNQRRQINLQPVCSLYQIEEINNTPRQICNVYAKISLGDIVWPPRHRINYLSTQTRFYQLLVDFLLTFRAGAYIILI